MAGIDDGFGWQFAGQAGEALLHVAPRTALKVGAAYAHTEQRVAREGYALLGTIERAAAGRVTRRVDDLQLVGAEADALAVGEEVAYGRCGVPVVHAEEVAGLLRQVAHEELVGLMHLGLQLELVIERVVAEAVVQMAVGAEHMAQLQPVVAQKLTDGRALAVVVGAAVYHHCLATVVVDNIAVLLQHVALESLDGHHRGR